MVKQIISNIDSHEFFSSNSLIHCMFEWLLCKVIMSPLFSCHFLISSLLNSLLFSIKITKLASDPPKRFIDFYLPFCVPISHSFYRLKKKNPYFSILIFCLCQFITDCKFSGFYYEIEVAKGNNNLIIIQLKRTTYGTIKLPSLLILPSIDLCSGKEKIRAFYLCSILSPFPGRQVGYSGRK